MAIVKEFYSTRSDRVNLYRTYSDQNFYIRKVGTEEIYDEAIDIENANYEYEETAELIVDKKEERDDREHTNFD